jgi:acyl carrier protein
LYIGGDGLARGYLHREELTSQRFLASPFIPGALLYRTGDLARWRLDGTLECLGRADSQIKLRGFRIELGEIEAALARHPAVKECAVMVREDTPGDKMLAAYLIPNPGEAPDTTELRSHLKKDLPDYMVPSAFVPMDRFPLTPNGKIDRKALPAPSDRPVTEDQEFVGPRDETEQLLAGIWTEAFHLKQVGMYDNFFDLGGHSLLAVRIIKEIETHTGIRMPLTTLLEAPTIADLAEILGMVMLDLQDQPEPAPPETTVPLENAVL